MEEGVSAGVGALALAEGALQAGTAVLEPVFHLGEGEQVHFNGKVSAFLVFLA